MGLSPLIFVGAAFTGLAWLGIKMNKATYDRFLQSTTASIKGIDNTPTADDKKRLMYIIAFAEPILALLLQRYPHIHYSSGYRSEDLNKEVHGDEYSRHRFGLAFDIGGFRSFQEIVEAALFLQEHFAVIPGLSQALRTVLAEDDHIHLDFFDILHKLNESRTFTIWRKENLTGSDPRWLPLAA